MPPQTGSRELNSFGEDAPTSKWGHFPRSFRDLLQAYSWCEEGSLPWRHFLRVTAKSTYMVTIFCGCVHLPGNRIFQGQDLTHLSTVPITVAGFRVATQCGFMALGMNESLFLRKWCNNVMLSETSTCTRKWYHKKVPKFKFAVSF